MYIENLYIENPLKIHLDGSCCENIGHYFEGVLCSSFSFSLFSSTISFRKGLSLWAEFKKKEYIYSNQFILKTTGFKSRGKVIHRHSVQQ